MSDDSGTTGANEQPYIPPPIGSIKPIRDVDDIFVFRFELGPAILAQLLDKLRQIPIQPLTVALDSTPYPGFYQLFEDERAVYIGRSERPIGQRLKEHVSKLTGRKGISLESIGCKYAFVEDPSLVDVSESALIDYFGEHGLAEWNQTGFGSKVTGYGRGKQKQSDWSKDYPPDLDLPVTAGADSAQSIMDLFKQIKANAPIAFSVPRDFAKPFKSDHEDVMTTHPIATRPFSEWVTTFESNLAEGWRVDREPEGWYVVKATR